MPVMKAIPSRDLPLWRYLLLSLIITSVSCDGNTTSATSQPEEKTSQVSLEASAAPTWVVTPIEPGQQLPAEGRSLFDFLVMTPSGKEPEGLVPFPFTALLEHINDSIEPKDQNMTWKGVLVPFNRSLQRHASNPDYLGFPRAVVSVVAEPTFQEHKAGLLLKDRLFLGYQEKSKVLEVISYNEAAGRFEFQVVTNYGPGLTPTVQYANRTLCITCHQNHSPIFSKPLWEETNSNPEVATLLEQHGERLYGIPIHQPIDTSQALDDSTNRASALSIAQFLWQEGCEKSTSFTDSVRCRGNLLTLLLQYRLNGRRQLDTQPQLNGNPLFTTLLEGLNWKWPQGLLVPTPDIPNRNPFDFFQMVKRQEGHLVRQISRKGLGKPHIRSIFEPSLERTSTHVPLIPKEKETGRYILNHLSPVLANVDIKRLDSHLRGQWPQGPYPLMPFHLSCEGTARGPAGNIDRLIVECTEGKSQSDKATPAGVLKGVLYLYEGHLAKGLIEHLRLSDGQSLFGLEVTPASLTMTKHMIQVRFGVIQPHSTLTGRQANGMAIKDIQLQLAFPDRSQSPRNSSPLLKGSSTITVIDDFSTVQQAINRLVATTISGESDVLGYKPFRRAVVMKSLFQVLGMPPLSWCCIDDHALPPLTSVAHDHHSGSIPKEDIQRVTPGLRLLNKYCANCHHEEEPFPPNFLHGSPQQVQTQVTSCAKRIFTRLYMWNVAPEDRHEAPMPPIMALNRAHLTADSWRNHSDFKAMQSYVSELIQAELQEPPDLNQMLAQGYDRLPDCLNSSANTISPRGTIATS